MSPNSKEEQEEPPRQHGVRGVYYGGQWVDIEDCGKGGLNKYNDPDIDITNYNNNNNNCDTCTVPCPRSRTRFTSVKQYVHSMNGQDPYEIYDIVIIGAGCIGACIARTICQYNNSIDNSNPNHHQLSILWLDAADDITQGATKGNSGIVHAGYDDTPGSVRSQHCSKGNSMFPLLDQQLHFGYQQNGSLVLATNDKELQELYTLYEKGQLNNVPNLEVITDIQRLRTMEPYINHNVIGALYAPTAGNVIPYEFTIACRENAIDNGVELRLRTKVIDIQLNNNTNLHQEQKNQNQKDLYPFTIKVEYWEPSHYVLSKTKEKVGTTIRSTASVIACIAITLCCARILGWYLLITTKSTYQYSNVSSSSTITTLDMPMILSGIIGIIALYITIIPNPFTQTVKRVTSKTPIQDIIQNAGLPQGGGSNSNSSNHVVQVQDMFIGGSGSCNVQNGIVVQDPILNGLTLQQIDAINEKQSYHDNNNNNPSKYLPSRTNTIQCSYIINCAGGASDQIAAMIQDYSFKIKPRLGDYILLNRNQGHLAKHTLFPCPDPVLGKGVLVQTTLWGNLILGPTARDTYKAEARDMSPAAIQEYILSQCKKLVPTFDPKETIHAFCGARAKSDRGDWIIEPSKVHPQFIHVAGIDSPGLAGAPSIALKVVDLLKEAGLASQLSSINPKFNPYRYPIITPKDGMKGLKMGPVGKFDSDGSNIQQMASNVICKCEKVTELEVVRAIRRGIPIDSSQAIRKRTRAGMGHCQGDVLNFNCESRVRAIIARENQVPIEQIGGRPWPATSTLSQRWIDDKEKKLLQDRMNK